MHPAPPYTCKKTMGQNPLSFSVFFFFWGGGGANYSMQKFRSQGSNLWCHSRDNTRSLTHWATRELPGILFLSSFLFFFLSLSYLFRATPMAYGGSQARAWIGAVAASLFLSHSHTRSKLRLQPTEVLNPLSEARDWTWVLMVTSRVRYCWATTGTPGIFFLTQTNSCVGISDTDGFWPDLYNKIFTLISPWGASMISPCC